MLLSKWNQNVEYKMVLLVAVVHVQKVTFLNKTNDCEGMVGENLAIPTEKKKKKTAQIEKCGG